MNNELSIHSLHNDILRNLPFTVSGNAAIERSIFQFLQKVAESPFLLTNKQIKFVMGGFAKININNLQDLFQENWVTERLRSFFFYDYEDDDVELLLSIYHECIRILTEEELNGVSVSKNLTNIICDNNYGGINFRVKVVEGISKIKITHIKRERVLEALIPRSFYKEDFNVLELSSATAKNPVNIERSKDNPYEFFRVEGKVGNYQELLEQIYEENYTPQKFRESSEDFILNSHISESIKNKYLKNPNAKINEIYSLFYLSGLFAYLLDCNIEYFTSVTNNVGGCKHSLGSIAVGYKEDFLDNDIRAFFNICSNHIASNLATQIILDSNDMQYYVLRRKFQEQFIENLLKHIGLYNQTSNENETSTGNKIPANETPLYGKPHDGYLSRNHFVVDEGKIKIIETSKKDFVLGVANYKKKDVESSFGENFIQYLVEVLKSDEIDYGLYETFHSYSTSCPKINKFYEYYKNKDCSGVGIKLTENQINLNQDSKEVSPQRLNVYLPHLLITTLEKEKDEDRKFEEIITDTIGSVVVIKVKYKNEINLKGLINSFLKGEGGSFNTFIRANYEAFRTCGDLIIKDTLSDKFRVSLKNDFKIESINSEKKKFVFIGNPNSSVSTKEITFEIHYNLF